MKKCCNFLFALLLFVLPVYSSQYNLTHRTARQGVATGIFSVVNFPNIPCRGSNNLNGTCLSSSECFGTGGQAKGACANGFGTCCFYSLSTCGGTITRNQTYIQNPNYPDSYSVSSDTTCEYKFSRINDDVCQVRLDFEKFDLGPPVYPAATRFTCEASNTDYVTFTYAGGQASRYNLCGYNPGQHVYIDMGTPNASPNTATMSMTFDATNWASYNRYFNIMASQIECNTAYYAPKGCDQYFFGNGGSGVIQAFNYDQDSLTYAARLSGYLSMCVRREQGKCVIGYTPPDIASDPYGFSMNGNPATLSKGRNSCSFPQTSASCTNAYLRIPQGNRYLGVAPYTEPPTTGNSFGCDRFCAKRLCAVPGGCDGTNHMTIWSKNLPFTLMLESTSHLTTRTGNKGYKLNYHQLSC